MAQPLLLCLILADAFVGLAMAGEKVQAMVDPSAEAPMARKLGKHNHHKMVHYSSSTPNPSPSAAPQAEEQVHSRTQTSSLDKTASSEPNKEDNSSVLGQVIHLGEHHHSVDKSVAGGGVILGGLATTFLVAVFCYIRATGRHKAESTSA